MSLERNVDRRKNLGEIRASSLQKARRRSRFPRIGRSLETLETRLLMANRVWDGGGDGSTFTQATNWAGDVAPVNGDDVQIPNVAATTNVNYNTTVTLNSLTSDEPFTLNGGTLTLTGAADFNNTFVFNNGAINGGTVELSATSTWNAGTFGGSAVVTNLGTLTTQGAANRTLGAGTNFVNPGTFRHAATGALVLSGAAFNNSAGALFDVQGDADILDGGSGPAFNNAGTFRKSAGTGSSTLSVALNNSGAVETQTGVSSFNAAGTHIGSFSASDGARNEFRDDHVFNAGASLAGVGVNRLVSGTATIAGAAANTGNFEIVGGTLAGAGPFNTSGNFDFSGGTITGTVVNSGNAVLSGANINKFFAAATFVNQGTLAYTGERVFFNSGSTIDNRAGGLIDIQSDGDLAFNVAPQSVIKNAGTLRKSAGAAESIVGIQVDNAGAVQAQTGVLSFDGGGVHSGAFSASNAARNEFAGNHTLNAGTTFNGAGVNRIVSGTVNAAGTVANTSAFEIVGGTLAGAGPFNTSGNFDFSGGFITGTVVNSGNAVLSGANINKFFAAATFVNQGTLAYTGERVFFNSGSTIDNRAGGLIDLQSDGDLAFNVAPQSVIKNAGTLRKSAGAASSVVSIDFNNTGTVDVDTGTLQLSGAFSNFAGTTLTGGTYLIDSIFRFNNANIATNAATIVLNGPASSILSQTGANAFANFATNAADGSFSILNGRNFTRTGAFANAGNIEVGEGSTFSATVSYTQTSGMTELAGGTLTSPTVAIQGGLLEGSGTINGNVNSAGTVVPGASPGLLSINGNFSQTAAGAMNIEVGGVNPGTQFDRINVSGTASINGTLNVSRLNNFIPNGADVFAFLVSGGARTGVFSTITGLDLPNGREFEVIHAPNEVRLETKRDVIVNPTTGLSTSESGGTANFSVVLTAPPTANVVVPLSVSDASEGSLAVPNLTFTPANWDVPQVVTVTGVNDGITDGPVAYTIATGNVASADPRYAGINPDDVAAINEDDEGAVPSITISDARIAEGRSGTRNLVFTASLSFAISKTVTAAFATADGSATAGTDYDAASGTLSFTPGTTSKTINVRIIGDLDPEADENFFLNLTTPVNAEIADDQAVGLIVNDDPLPAISISDVVATEGDAGTKNFSFRVTLSAPSASPVTVQFATANGSATAGTDFAANSGVVNLAPNQTSKNVVIVVNGDASVEADEEFFVNLTNPTNAVIADGQAIGSILNDDASLTIGDASVLEGNLGVSVLTFQVALSQPVGADVTANFVTGGGNASAGTDYLLTGGTILIPAGTTQATINVPVLGDFREELDETFNVTLSSPRNAAIADAQAVGTILDDDPTPSVSIGDVTIVEGDAGTKRAVFTVLLSRQSGLNVSVDFATAPGVQAPATDGVDFVGTAGQLRFTPGQTSKTINVTINGDVDVENDETFLVQLSNAVNATIADAQAIGVIVNDDEPPPTISIGDVTILEGNSGTRNAVFTATLSRASSKPVSVDFATADDSAIAGSDYNAIVGTLTFAPGQTSRTFNVAIIPDTINEPNERFLVNLTNPSNATIADGQAVGLIVNDDPTPAISISDVVATEGDAGTKNFSFRVSLSAPSASPVTVQFATANGSATAGTDFAANSGVVNFAPNQTSKNVVIVVNGDASVEADEDFFVNLTNSTNAVIADAQGRGSILNDDASFSIGDASLVEGNLGDSLMEFTVTLSTALPVDSTVDFSTSNGSATSNSDFVPTFGRLNFPAGQTSRRIQVPIVGDDRDEIDETFSVNLSSPRNAILGDAQGTGTILDDDATPTLSITDVTIVEGDSGTKNAVFTVLLSAPSGQRVDVEFATTDGSAIVDADYQAASGILRFNPGQTSKNVTIRVIGDLVLENNEQFFVDLSNAIGATIQKGRGVGIIVNDDVPSGSGSLNALAVDETPARRGLEEGDSSASSTAPIGSVSVFDIVLESLEEDDEPFVGRKRPRR